MLFTPIKPMLLTSAKESFDDDDYIFEPKWDGHRILLHKKNDRIEAFTRHGNIVTSQFPELQQAISDIDSDEVILDCEGIVLVNGKPNLDAIAYRSLLSDPLKIKQAMMKYPASFVAFDIIYNGEDLRRVPLIERKKILEDTITDSSFLLKTMFVEGKGKDLHQLTIQQGLEGIVCKVKNSTYRVNKRSNNWIKVKNYISRLRKRAG